MNVLPGPLLLLIALRFRAVVRIFFRSVRTPKGIAVALFAILGVVVMVVPAVIAAFVPRPPPSPEVLAVQARTIELMPFGLLGFVLLAMVRTSGDGALAFLQAEVDFLFPAPFTRQQLLFYKLAQRVFPLLLVSLFFSLWVRNLATSWSSAWVGVLLSLWFIHLASLVLALGGQVLGSRRFARWRWAAALLTLGLVVAGVILAGRELEQRSPLAMLEAFATSPFGRIVAAPTIPFARVITSTSVLGDGAQWVALAGAINLALVVLAVRLDANWLEAGADSSRKLADRLEEMRRSGGFGGGGAALSGVRVPMPPRLGGVGPLMWRQCVTGVRQGARGLLLIVVMVAVVVAPPLLTSTGQHWSVALKPLGAVALAYMSLFLPQILRLDFRADIDRMDLLKGLPVSPFAVTLAQVLVPAALITGLQAPLAMTLNATLAWGIPHIPLWIPALFLANLVNASLENLAFLMWPVRPSRGAGVQFAVSQMLGQIAKMIALVLCMSLAAAAGVGAYLAAGSSVIGAAAAATAVLLAEAGVIVAILTRRFATFDPASEQTPDG